MGKHSSIHSLVQTNLDNLDAQEALTHGGCSPELQGGSIIQVIANCMVITLMPCDCSNARQGNSHG